MRSSSVCEIQRSEPRELGELSAGSPLQPVEELHGRDGGCLAQAGLDVLDDQRQDAVLDVGRLLLVRATELVAQRTARPWRGPRAMIRDKCGPSIRVFRRA